MFHKVQIITPLPNFILRASFEDGSVKEYDVKTLFDKIDAFQALINLKGLFEQVQIDCGGHGIMWNDDLDLAAEELYYNGVSIK